jgi:hypothetical protein
MKKIASVIIASVLTIHAFSFRLEYGNNVVIARPVYEDLYISAGSVTINAPVFGDLICTGGTIDINDSVSGDIIVAGGTVTFNGNVGDDIRCAGGRLYVQKNIVGDLVIAGGQVTVNRDVVIGGGLLMGGGDITFNGTVNKSVKAGFGSLVFNGRAEKDIDVKGGNLQMNGTVMGPAVIAANKITIGNDASFNNNVRYWNNKGSVDFGQSIKNGKAIYDPSLKIATGRWYYLGGLSVLGLLWYIGMALLMIAIIQYLFNATMQKAGDTVFNKTLKSSGFGLLFFIAVPIAAIIAFITVIGVPLGLLLLFNYIILILLATVITSLVAAHWINNRFNYQWGFWKLVFAALGIFIVLKLISSMPFVGWLIVLIATCGAFGAILQNINWKRKQQVELTA